MRWSSAAVLLLACGQGDGYPPVARIALAPEVVPEGDDHTTVVRLDGTRSCDEVDGTARCASEPGDPVPDDLTFAWELLDDDARLDHASDPIASATLSGKRPVEVHLTVTDADGLSSTARAFIGLAIDP